MSEIVGKRITDLERITSKFGKMVKTKEEVPKVDAELKNYMKKHLKLTESTNFLINALIRAFNEKGSHALISKKEYFRLTRNIMIEIILLLLTKLENFESNQ